MSRSIRRFSWLVLILLLLGGFAFSQYLNLDHRIPDEMRNGFGIEVKLDNSNVNPFKRQIVLTNVHLAQPPGFGANDALFIRKITIDFDGYGHNPLVIRSVELNGVQGNAVFGNQQDNFSALQEFIDANYKAPAHDFWATPTVIQTIQVRNATVSNNNLVTKLPDRNSQPIGTMQQTVPLKWAVGMAISKVLENEKQGLAPIAASEIKAKADAVIQDVTRKVVEKIHNFMNDATPATPAPAQQPGTIAPPAPPEPVQIP